MPIYAQPGRGFCGGRHLPCAHEFDGVDPDPEGLVSRSLGHDGMAMVGRECLDGAHVGHQLPRHPRPIWPPPTRRTSRLALCRRCTTASASEMKTVAVGQSSPFSRLSSFAVAQLLDGLGGGLVVPARLRRDQEPHRPGVHPGAAHAVEPLGARVPAHLARRGLSSMWRCASGSSTPPRPHKLLHLPARRSPGLGVGGWFIPIVQFLVSLPGHSGLLCARGTRGARWSAGCGPASSAR